MAFASIAVSLGVGLLAPAASATTSNPSFVMTDNFGYVWSLRPAGGQNGTQTYAGTVQIRACGLTWDASASKTNDKSTGTWDWTFLATNPSPGAFGCADWFQYTGTGIGYLSGTWVNSAGRSGYWSSDTSKGAGTPPDSTDG